MSKVVAYFSSQFGNPTGIIGRICCKAMNIGNRKLYAGLLNTISPGEDSRVLEIGYGNGYLIQNLIKQYNPQICGIDISEDMQATAMHRNRKAVSNERVALTVGDCCSLPYEDHSFDCAVSVNTIYFWKDTLQGLKELHRVLRKGTCFYTAVYTKEWFDKSSLEKTRLPSA